ncbi:MAG: class I SAM-dependent methyltransferase, partial [Parabacteroides sp.]|nr:class I SAM-dependent methyltransferase [Parabacteroides sp.]
DILTLGCSMFDYLLKILEEKVRMLEIGSFFGCSSYFAAKTMGLLKSDALLYCCDNWKGANGGVEYLSGCVDTMAYFRGVMRYLGVSEQIVPLAGDSSTCLDAFRDDYFDIIFIDGGHQYETVLNDITTAVRLIKPGGLIMGHDCECLFSQLPEKIKTKKIDTCEIADGCYHTGVIFALEALFHGNYEKPITNSLMWVKKIMVTDKHKILQSESAEWKAIRELADSLAEKLDHMAPSDEELVPMEEAAAVGRIYADFERRIADLKYESAFREIKNRIVEAYDCHLSLINASAGSDAKACASLFEKETVLVRQLIENIDKRGGCSNER